MAEILIMEPELRLGMKMRDVLSRAGHTCTLAQTTAEGLKAIDAHDHLITVLNARMPWADSYTFLRTLNDRSWPVLFISGDAASTEHLRAMYPSACEVLLSPFDARALLTSVSTLAKAPDALLTLGSLQLDPQSRQVRKNGQVLTLTAQEFALLHALMQSPDAALTREELLRTAWGYQNAGETRTVDVHIQRLRRKIGSACIETVYKLGYRLRSA